MDQSIFDESKWTQVKYMELMSEGGTKSTPEIGHEQLFDR